MSASLVESSGEVGDGGFSRVSWEERLAEERGGVGEDCFMGVEVVMTFWIVLYTAVSLSSSRWKC